MASTDHPLDLPGVSVGLAAALRRVDVAGVPKTYSGKMLGKTTRGITDRRNKRIPSTIGDPAVLADSA